MEEAIGPRPTPPGSAVTASSIGAARSRAKSAIGPECDTPVCDYGSDRPTGRQADRQAARLHSADSDPDGSGSGCSGYDQATG